MTRIRLYDHPLAVVEPKRFEVASLGQWLLDHYGDAPTVKVQIFKGEPCAENEISYDLQAILASDSDEYVILQSPGGFDPFTWLLIVVAVVSVAAIVLMPKPVMPGNVNRTQQSPNNALGSRENQVRLLERVEDIYGTVKSIPSLMMPTYNKYIGHQKFEYGYYCVGRGYYAIAELRDGDTLIADIAGASASVYDPFTSPNSGHAPVLQVGDAIIDDVLTVKRAIEVDGITLKAANQVELPSGAAEQYSYAPGGVIVQAFKRPNFNAVCAVGDTVTVAMDNFLVETTPAVPPDGMGGGGSPAVYATYNYTGSYTVASIGDGTLTVSGASWPVFIPFATSYDDGTGPPPGDGSGGTGGSG